MSVTRRVELPGFGITLGLTLAWFGLIVLIPLAALVARAASLSFAEFTAVVTAPRALAAYGLSFGGAAAAGVINAVFGFVVAWVLTRYSFPGRRILDAMVDLPFALPTAVSGIALCTLYAKNGLIGRWASEWGFPIAYTRAGVLVALVFIGFPFVVRTLQPALMELEPELEEAAAMLGARRLQVFLKVIVPALRAPILTGFTLAVARAIGEYGSVIFIAGNMPMKTEIAPLLIVMKLEQYDEAGAAAIASVMLATSLALLLAVNLLHRRSRSSDVRETAPEVAPAAAGVWA